MSQTPDLPALLQQHFGYSSFRPLQEDIVRTLIAGKDCLVVMPTGSGKSLCFQLPALCMPGTALVISPLIALMKDQVDGLRADGVSAAFLNSSQTASEQAEIEAAVRRGEIKLLYIAPERLAAAGFRSFLSSIKISLLAIDEAHCISTWGHEFRPDYRMLAPLREMLPAVPCIALTATATPQVREDIRTQLHLERAAFFLSSFNRENLTYHVYPKQKAFERLLVVLQNQMRLPAIVYCFSRKDTEALAADLRAEGFAALPYHAGLDPAVRRATQEKFMRDDVRVIAATIAFGMGIDKPDVRTVVHMDLPKNIESYYQETGRAGRDGLPSDCILFHTWGDKFKQDFFIGQITDPAQQQMAREKLQQMLDYAQSRSCRRARMLSYFGEQPAATCNGCDCCLTVRETFDATEIAQKILSAVIRTGERFGTAHVCDVLRGKNTERIRSLTHDALPVFGIVKEFDDRQLRQIVTALLEEKLLAQADGLYPTLTVTEAGRRFLKDKTPLTLPAPDERLQIAERAGGTDTLTFDSTLFEELRALRRGIAEQQGVAAFIVFGDRSLREMAAYFPQSPEAFMKIYGVSDRKLEQFGGQFIDVIKGFCVPRGIAERTPVPGASSGRKPRTRSILRSGSTFDETRQLLAEKLSLKDMARRRGLKEGTIIQHLEELIRSGAVSPEQIAWLRPPPQVFDEIAASFTKHGAGALAPIFSEFDGEFTYDVLRLARIFFVLTSRCSPRADPGNSTAA